MSDRKVALVTGGSRGIGRAICVELASRNYFTVINFRSNADQAQETLDMIKQAGGDGRLAPFDVTDQEAAAAQVENIVKQYERIDCLVNNAGIVADGLFAMMSKETWDKVIDVSLDGFYNLTKPVLQWMIRKRQGTIVTVSSISGLIGNRGQANYAAAKAGLIGASKSIAQEVARLGIRVNVVAPGLIETDMIKDAPLDEIRKVIPMRRIGKPEDVAKAVAFLCSDDASYITGHVLTVSGGLV